MRSWKILDFSLLDWSGSIRVAGHQNITPECILYDYDFRIVVHPYLENFTYPNKELNGRYSQVKISDSDSAKQAIQNILVNFHPIYLKENTDHCIWYDTRNYWRVGKCENLGKPVGKPLYYKGCIDFQSNERPLLNDIGNIKIIVVGISAAEQTDQVSSAALLGYVIKNGKYRNLCNWVYVRRIRQFRCLKKPNYSTIRATVKNTLRGVTGDKNYRITQEQWTLFNSIITAQFRTPVKEFSIEITV